MSRTRGRTATALAATALAATALAASALAAAALTATALTGTVRAGGTALVPGSAVSGVSAASLAGAVSSSQQLTIQVWLEPDLAGATAFAAAVATPGSAEFHQYLSPSAYTARFGPSAAHAAAVATWLTASGLTQVHASSGRDYVSATGPVSKVQSAFGVQIDRYRVMAAIGPSAVIQSSDRDVSVPASLAPDVLAVTGLNSAAAPASLVAQSAAKAATCSAHWAQHVQTFHPVYRGLTEGSLPVCGYSAGQLRAAYGATWANTAKGETVAFVESGGPPAAMSQTLADYAKRNHLPAPKSGQFREVQSGSVCHPSSASVTSSASASPSLNVDDESQLDSEAVYALAPGASQLMVLPGGCDQDQGLLDADLTVLTGKGGHPSATIVSNSWQIPLGVVSAQTVHAIDLRAVAEGVGMYFAAGDDPGLYVTSSDPGATVVGGTTLALGARNNRLFETGWSDDTGYLDNGKWTDAGIGGTGGGTSLVWRQPAYQKGVVPASMSHVRVGKQVVTDRAVPDIAADADVDTGLLVGYIQSVTNGKPGPYQTAVNGGTSLACPLIAAMVADAQQGRSSSLGFINPLIYRLAGTPAFHDILPLITSAPQQDRDAYHGPAASASVDVFDSQERAYTQQVTARGYDTMTGIGTPNGSAFITALRRAAR